MSSSAALRPTSGLAPAPSPLVSLLPSCSFTGACESFSACRSVLAAMNSTPSTLARIMRLTALHPPPPTPITLIFAPSCNSSLNEIRMPDSFAMLPPQCYNVRIFSPATGRSAPAVAKKSFRPLFPHAPANMLFNLPMKLVGRAPAKRRVRAP